MLERRRNTAAVRRPSRRVAVQGRLEARPVVQANPSLHRLLRRVMANHLTYPGWKRHWEKGGGHEAVKEAYARRPDQERGGAARYEQIHQDELDSAIQLGEEHWLSEPARPLGSDMFWNWIALHSNLYHLTIMNFDQPVSPRLRQQLQPVLSSLPVVETEQTISDDILAMIPRLDKVETLYLGRVFFGPVELTAPNPFAQPVQPESLRRLRLRPYNGDFPELNHLGFSLINLIALDLYDHITPASPSPSATSSPPSRTSSPSASPSRRNGSGRPPRRTLDNPPPPPPHQHMADPRAPLLLSSDPGDARRYGTRRRRLRLPCRAGGGAEVEEVPRWRERYLPSLQSLVIELARSALAVVPVEELREIE